MKIKYLLLTGRKANVNVHVFRLRIVKLALGQQNFALYKMKHFQYYCKKEKN